VRVAGGAAGAGAAGNSADGGTTACFAVPTPVKVPLVDTSTPSAARVTDRFSVPRASIWTVPEYGW